jgi:hypothetical protein
MRHKFEEILQLAKTAAKWDLDSDEGYAATRKLAREAKINKDQLVYYVNAYQAAGESGLKALTYKMPMPEKIRLEATHKISEFLLKHLPQNHHKDKIGFQIVAKGNRITASEKRPLFEDSKQSSCVEFFQVRYTDFDQRWHLYWKRLSGKWWVILLDMG